jgi:hypothetical protein
MGLIECDMNLEHGHCNGRSSSPLEYNAVNIGMQVVTFPVLHHPDAEGRHTQLSPISAFRLSPSFLVPSVRICICPHPE